MHGRQQWRARMIAAVIAVWALSTLPAVAFTATAAPPPTAATVAKPRPGLNGAPPVERFSPDIDVYPQNFDVVQDPRGIVYVANYEGLLEFDSERWQLTPMPNGDQVRSMAIGPDGTLYAGGYDLFGYFKRDALGNLNFVDLSPKFRAALNGREIADIWQVVIAPEGVYFRALYELFFWDPKTGATAQWHHPGRFGVVAHHFGKTMIQFRGEGFKVRDGNEWRLRPESSHLTKLIQSLIPLADGGVLTLGDDGKWWRIDATTVTPAAMPPDMPPSSNYTRGMMLRDKSLALISVEGAVVMIDPGLTVKREVKLESGFLSGINPANDGGFLVSAQQSIYRVMWPSAWSVLGTEHGADGDFDKMAEWDGGHYLMASGGALRMRRTPAGIRFERMPWSNGSVFDLIGIDKDRALLAGTHRLAVIDHGKVHDHSSEIIYPRQFLRSAFRPAQIFLGTDNGVRVVDTSGGKIRVSANLPREITASVFTMVERSASELWVGTGRHGPWRYTLSEKGEMTAARQFGSADGLRFGKLAECIVATHPDGSLLVSTRKGIFRLEGEKFVETDLDGLGKLRGADELVNLLFIKNGDQWAYGPTRIYYRPKGGVWRQQEVRTLRRGAIGIAHVGAFGQVLFVCSNALLIRHPQIEAEEIKPPQVLLRRVTQLMPDGGNVVLPHNGDGVVHLPLGNFGVRFEFALPELVRPGIKRYQGRLIGVEEGISEWGEAARFTYSDLHAREYKLEVRAMDSRGHVTTLAPFSIIVDPPWYATAWARTAAVLLLMALAWLAVSRFTRYRTQRLEREKIQLEAKVDARTRELEEAIRRLDMMAHVDGLTGVPNRRRLDEYLEVVWANCAEQGKPLSLLAIDVDHFKEYNDRLGHLAGDELLKKLVRECMSCLRRTEDLLARYGGEEFFVVLPSADIDVAQPLAETIRQKVGGSTLGVTISIGVCRMMPAEGGSVAALIADADAALYAAKRAGRNRVFVHGEPEVARPQLDL